MTVYTDDQGRKYTIIFRAWRTNPTTGEREYAKQYGKRAWPIRRYL